MVSITQHRQRGQTGGKHHAHNTRTTNHHHGHRNISVIRIINHQGPIIQRITQGATHENIIGITSRIYGTHEIPAAHQLQRIMQDPEPVAFMAAGIKQVSTSHHSDAVKITTEQEIHGRAVYRVKTPLITVPLSI